MAQVKNKYINIKELEEITNLSKRQIYRKLKTGKGFPAEKIKKTKGKATLYHISAADYLKDTYDFLSYDDTYQMSQPDTTMSHLNNNKTNTTILNKEIDFFKNENEVLKTNNERLQKNFDGILQQMKEKDNRHDTIIMTMSKQLEALNEKMLLLEDKREEEKEKQLIKNTSFNIYNTTIKASTIAILIIIYFKILYI